MDPRLTETIRWVRSSDETQRATRGFQKRLWDDNHVASIGQGNIAVDRALDDADFRHRLAARSMAPLPASVEERLKFLTAVYQDLTKQLESFVRSVAHLKIFRVLAASYPDAMTTIASMGAPAKLTSAMDGDRALDSAGRHVWVRHRLDCLLGGPDCDPLALLPTFVVYMNHFQIGPEERALDSLFAQEYQAFHARVRRWI